MGRRIKKEEKEATIKTYEEVLKQITFLVNSEEIRNDVTADSSRLKELIEKIGRDVDAFVFNFVDKQIRDKKTSDEIIKIINYDMKILRESGVNLKNVEILEEKLKNIAVKECKKNALMRFIEKNISVIFIVIFLIGVLGTKLYYSVNTSYNIFSRQGLENAILVTDKISKYDSITGAKSHHRSIGIFKLIFSWPFSPSDEDAQYWGTYAWTITDLALAGKNSGYLCNVGTYISSREDKSDQEINELFELTKRISNRLEPVLSNSRGYLSPKNSAELIGQALGQEFPCQRRSY